VSWAIKERDYSQRRACALVGLAPKVYRYRRRSDDGVLRTRLRALAAHRRRFGYRRLHLLLRREQFARTANVYVCAMTPNILRQPQ
jgi:putative transposase